jgi:LysM domain
MKRCVGVAAWLGLLGMALWALVERAGALIPFSAHDPSTWPGVALRWVCVALVGWLLASTMAMALTSVAVLARWRPRVVRWSPVIVRRIVGPLALSVTSMSLLAPAAAMASSRSPSNVSTPGSVAVATMAMESPTTSTTSPGSASLQQAPVTIAPATMVKQIVAPDTTTNTVPANDVLTHDVPLATMTVDGVAPAEPTAHSDHHVVTRNEHFWSIATDELTEQLGRRPTQSEVSTYWRQLIDANRQVLKRPNNPNLLYPGQDLTLPPPNQ